MLDINIQTHRLLLRPLNMEDAPAMLNYLSDLEVVRYLRIPQKNRVSECEAIIQNHPFNAYKKGQPSPLGIVLKGTDSLVGTISLKEVCSESKVEELAFVLCRSHWGQGIVAEAVNAMLQHGFTRRNLLRIQATCATPNVQSMRVMEKCGMQREGILRQSLQIRGHQYDQYMYSILREEWLLRMQSLEASD